MIKLTPRLKTIAQLVPKGTIIADVGTDHGYVPAWLIKKNIIPFAWATDVQQGPLENARKTVKEENLEDRIHLRLGSGLAPLRGETPQGIIIAGMGGLLISEILQADDALAKEADFLILQPMTGQPELRRWLVTNGYRIEKDRLAKEGSKLYEVIVAKAGQSQEPDSLKDLIGYEISTDLEPLFPHFIEKMIHRYRKILNETSKSGNAEHVQLTCKDILKQLEAMKL